jgi:hypothetical protein
MIKPVFVAALAAVLFSTTVSAQAPPDTADWTQYKSPYAGEENDIANPNRTSDEVMAWGTKTVAEALTFGLSDFNARIKDLKRYFVQTGWADYAAYLKDSKLLDVARSGKYMVASASNGAPMILNKGPQNGAFHWEISVPVITSINQPSQSGEVQTVSSSRTYVKMLITRVAEGGMDGMAIESWRVEEAQK